MTRRHLPPLLFTPLLLTLAACGGSSGESTLFARDDSPAVATVPVGANADGGGASFSQAVMLLPIDAGAVTRIRERHFANGSRQDIVMGWDAYSKAENILEVSIETAPARIGGFDILQIGKPSERGIRTEILARFPKTPMNIVTKPMQNAFGTFGLAIGKQANGNRCIFAWQWIDDIRSVGQNRSGFSKLGSLVSGRAAPASVRVRLCRDNMTVDQLASYMEALHLGEPGALTRILTLDRKSLEPTTSPVSTLPAGRDSGLVSAAPVASAGTLESALAGGAPRPTAVARTSSARPARRVARRARSKQEDASPRETTQPAASAYPMLTQQPAGPRYLGPVPQQQPGLGFSAGRPSQPRLNPSLPPQAYRGPTSQDSYRSPNAR